MKWYLFELIYQILCNASGARDFGTISNATHPALFVTIAVRVVTVTPLVQMLFTV